MSDGIKGRHNFPPITDEDLAGLEVDPQLIPFVVSTAQRAEQSSSGEPQLTPTEAENLVEILDRVVSSHVVDPGLKSRCFKVLRKVSPAHGILPRTYHLAEVTLSDDIPYASGGFANIWKGQLGGIQVCVKAFRPQIATNLGRIKRRFYRDIIGWKYVTHPNVVPFLGVSETLFPFCTVNPWLPNGNILEYTRKNQRANRLQLLAQAACGLQYLHSLGVVHSDVKPGNILIDEDGSARLGDFGIAAVLTDPTVVEPSGTTTSMSGAVRYMAPELLNPPQFNFHNSNPTKESDIYSLAVTTYEVLTEIVPYGNARDSIITFHVVRGDRPPRPQNAPWLRDDVWDMIGKCWSEQWEMRWDARAVFNQLSLSSVQDTAEDQREVRTAAPTPHSVGGPPPPRQDATGERSSILVKERDLRSFSNFFSQRKVGKKSAKRESSMRPSVAPLPSAPKPAKNRFTWPGASPNPKESEIPYEHQASRPGRLAFWSSKRVRPVVNALGRLFRLRKFSRTHEPSSG